MRIVTLLLTIFPVICFANESLLNCKGVDYVGGEKLEVPFNFTVHITSEPPHIVVAIGDTVVIDDTVNIYVNKYSYKKRLTNNAVDTSFTMNKTTLEYSFENSFPTVSTMLWSKGVCILLKQKT